MFNSDSRDFWAVLRRFGFALEFISVKEFQFRVLKTNFCGSLGAAEVWVGQGLVKMTFGAYQWGKNASRSGSLAQARQCQCMAAFLLKLPF